MQPMQTGRCGHRAGSGPDRGEGVGERPSGNSDRGGHVQGPHSVVRQSAIMSRDAGLGCLPILGSLPQSSAI